MGAAAMLLSEIKEGQSAVIDRIGGNGKFRRRILEMGIVKGTKVYVEKYAPLRDPLELIPQRGIFLHATGNLNSCRREP